MLQGGDRWHVSLRDRRRDACKPGACPGCALSGSGWIGVAKVRNRSCTLGVLDHDALMSSGGCDHDAGYRYLLAGIAV